MHKKETHYI